MSPLHPYLKVLHAGTGEEASLSIAEGDMKDEGGNNSSCRE